MRSHDTGLDCLPTDPKLKPEILTDKSDFDPDNLLEDIKSEAQELTKPKIPPHNEILAKMKAMIQRIDFKAEAGLQEDEKLKNKHFEVVTIDKILESVKVNNWHLCTSNGATYLYNGDYWKLIDRELLRSFFGECAEQMGVNHIDSRHYAFREALLKQFHAVSNLPAPDPSNKISINLINGTLDVIGQGIVKLRDKDPADFLKYVLPFEFDASAGCPMFKKYLNEVLPDHQTQSVLQEYCGYVFTYDLNLEKTLLLYGPGGNGKSVLIKVLEGMLGKENITYYSLESLTKANSYERVYLADALLNSCNEISGSLQADMFKQLASGQPIQVRAIYGVPFIMERYAKLMFACNKLPKDTEHTHGFFRRFLIIPFNQTIAKSQMDIDLGNKIVASELPGVLNWALQGLARLIQNRNFTESQAVEDELSKFKKESDSVATFLDEANLKPSFRIYKPAKDVYTDYTAFCQQWGLRPVGRNNFHDRIKNCGFSMEKKDVGQVIWVEVKNDVPDNPDAVEKSLF